MTKHDNHALDTRIAAALTGKDATADGVAKLLEEVDAAAHVATEAAERARLQALDPTQHRDADAARAEMEAAAFLRDRLHVAMTRLKDRLDELRISEEDSRRRKVYEQAAAERDQLAQQLSEIYPDFAQRLADLLARIEASNTDIEQTNLQLPKDAQPLLTAELVARKMDGWTKDAIDAPRLTASVRLPAFERTPHMPYAWPRQRQDSGVMMKELFALMEQTQAAAKAQEPEEEAELIEVMDGELLPPEQEAANA